MSLIASLGAVNVLTVSGFSGHVLTVEVIYDITQADKKGQLIMTGNPEAGTSRKLLCGKNKCVTLPL